MDRKCSKQVTVSKKEVAVFIFQSTSLFCCFIKPLKTLGWFFPSRDFSPNLKQDLSGLSGFFRQLRSKSCFKMSGLSGF